MKLAPTPEARPITAESQPVFPCWVFAPAMNNGNGKWFHMHDETPLRPSDSHWFPDQPYAPAIIPTAPLPPTQHGDTPRTDAVATIKTVNGGTQEYEIVPADFARTLERELVKWKTSANYLNTQADNFKHELTALRARVAELEQDRDRLDWLEATDCPRILSMPPNLDDKDRRHLFWASGYPLYPESRTVRAALDAARQQREGRPDPDESSDAVTGGASK